SANGIYHAQGGATVNANVEAFLGITGTTYTKSTVNRTTARSMPDPSTALSYYLSNGTTMQYSDLPRWSQTELFTNTTFETNVSGWYAYGGTATLLQSNTQKVSGTYSCYVSARSSSSAVAAQNVPVGSFTSGNTYQ